MAGAVGPRLTGAGTVHLLHAKPYRAEIGDRAPTMPPSQAPGSVPPIEHQSSVPSPRPPPRRSPHCGRRSPASRDGALDPGHPSPAPLGESRSERTLQANRYRYGQTVDLRRFRMRRRCYPFLRGHCGSGRASMPNLRGPDEAHLCFVPRLRQSSPRLEQEHSALGSVGLPTLNRDDRLADKTKRPQRDARTEYRAAPSRPFRLSNQSAAR